MRILVSCLILFSTLALQAGGGVPFSEHKFGKFKSGTQFDLVLEESEYSSVAGPISAKDDDGSFWGVEGSIPRSVATKMVLLVNGKKVSIRRKYFCDLSNIRSVDVFPAKNGLKISVTGGDAAGAYQCVFTVSRGRLIERFTHDGEFPEYSERIIIHSEIKSGDL